MHQIKECEPQMASYTVCLLLRYYEVYKKPVRLEFLDDYLRDASVIMLKKLTINGILADTMPESI